MKHELKKIETPTGFCVYYRKSNKTSWLYAFSCTDYDEYLDYTSEFSKRLTFKENKKPKWKEVIELEKALMIRG